jgi:hypothetical protein
MCVKLISVLAVLRKEFFGSGVQRRGAFATGGIGRTPARRIGAVIVVGLFKTWSHGGHPVPVAPIARPEPAVAAVSAWLLVRAFSSGCTTMTGVEAVSNGVQAFRDPKVKNAHATLTVIVATLILLLAGIAYLCRAYNIIATPPGQPRISECPVATHSSGDWPGRLLLHHHGCSPHSAGAFREYFLCRFSPSLSRHRHYIRSDCGEVYRRRMDYRIGYLWAGLVNVRSSPSLRENRA